MRGPCLCPTSNALFVRQRIDTTISSLGWRKTHRRPTGSYDYVLNANHREDDFTESVMDRP